MNNLPQHIGVIMDGNGRWAKKRGLPRSAGHQAGADTLKKIVTECNKMGIKYITVYAFSTENWKRPVEEVNGIMSLLKEYLIKAFDYEKEIRIFIIPSDDALYKVDQKNDYHIPIKWDNTILTDLVKSITISPNCTPLETQMIEKQIQDITQGAIKCRQSKLYSSFDPIIIEQ